MTRRPTEEDLGRATDILEQLAYRFDPKNNPNGWPDIVKLLDLWLWNDTELEHAKNAAAYGPGSDQAGTHTIGRYDSKPVEQRFDWGTEQRPRSRPELSDPLVRTLTGLRRTWRTRLGQEVDKMAEESREAANWPQRTQDAG
jgi:hypothetical protein